jgi:ABC-2 type transport system ATP-binding protein
MANIIEIKRISKSFDKREILKNVDLAVPQNGIFGIVGLNGAGKTTLIKCILSLIPDFDGEVLISGTDSRNNNARQCVAYMPEKFAPNINLTGYEYIEFYAKLYKTSFETEKVNKIAEGIELPLNFLQLKIGECSKGTIQKIGILACLYVDAQVIILDEPTTGLDILSRYSLKKILQKYSISKTIIFSSHILSDVEELAQNVAVVCKGEVVFSGEAKHFTKQQNAQTFEEAFVSYERTN